MSFSVHGVSRAFSATASTRWAAGVSGVLFAVLIRKNLKLVVMVRVNLKSVYPAVFGGCTPCIFFEATTPGWVATVKIKALPASNLRCPDTWYRSSLKLALHSV